ncbi:MAG: hypothetical protein ABII93_01840 [Chrysiogenia bacterium]
MTDQAQHPAGCRRKSLWPLAFFLSLAVVSLLLHAVKFRRGKDVLRLQEQYTTLVRIQPIEETKAQRVRFYETRFYLSYPMAVSYTSADLLRRIDGIVSPLRLLDSEVDPGLHDLAFKLSVGIAAAVPEAAQRRFAIFFEKLGNISGVTQVSYSPRTRRGPGSLSYVFDVSGRAEWR